MDDFNNINNTEHPQSELNGFDSAEKQQNESGYTVTPEGGFYNRQKDDIIQDDISHNEPETKTESQYETPPHTEPQNTYNQPKYAYNQNYNTTPPPVYNYQYNNYRKPQPQKEKKHHSSFVVALSCILAAVIGAVSGAGVVLFTKAPTTSQGNSSNSSYKNNVNIKIDETADSVAEAVAVKVTPSVVGIRTTTSVISFFGGSSQASGDGSGVVYSSDGYIITNYHVIADAISNKSASKIEVYLDSASAESHEATVVGYNISADLAVIKINVTDLTPIEVAKSDDLKVGQHVITVGNPGGLEFMDSVTFGIISGLNRVVSSDTGIELIQTDAAINPGNSGGALVNTKGELIGINSSKIVSEEFEGMGFAIPSNTVVKICDNIISKENSPEPYVGISISERYTAQVLKYYGFPAGAVVLSVADSSPAAEAGIERGDIITEFGDTKITEYTMLDDAIKNYSPDDSVTVKLYRNGRYYSTTIKIGANNAVQ